MGLNCKCDKKLNIFTDISEIDPIPYDQANALLGIDDCNKPVVVDKPVNDIDNAVMYEENDDINARANIILKNDNKLLLTTQSGGTINGIECSRFSDEGHSIVDIGSTTAHVTISAIDRPNVQLQVESGNHDHQMAFLADIQPLLSRISELEERLNNM